MPTLDTLDTPSVLIDLDRLERNIATMQARCDAAGVAFRPHIKTHKIPAIAQMQIDAGAIGIACQKVSEAEVFTAAGFSDLFIPYNIVGARKAARLADIGICNRVCAAADSEAVAAGYSAAAESAGITLRVMVELATEIARAGADVERAIDLALRIDADDHLHFQGVMVYPSTAAIRPALVEVIERLHRHGVGVETVSGGGIGAVAHMGDLPELTEMRVGTYVFNDLTVISKGLCTPDDCAMHITATVVSRPTSGRAILDAGSKTLTPERLGTDAAPSYGMIVEYPDARIYKLNEEHAYVDVSACERQPSVGEVVRLIPVHTCLVSNMHDRLYGVRGDQIEVVWEVAARGKVI